MNRNFVSLLILAVLMPVGAARADATIGTSAACPVDPAASTLRRGKLLYLQCAACHALGVDEPAKVGPHLAGLLDRPVAAVQGFPYSTALSAAGFNWTREKLDAWLLAPQALVPGNVMALASITRDSDRQALIDYLLFATSAACAAP